MKLLAYTIGKVQYLCNEDQIKEAGSLEKAAQKLHDEANPPKKMTAKEVKVEPTEEK